MIIIITIESYFPPTCIVIIISIIVMNWMSIQSIQNNISNGIFTIWLFEQINDWINQEKEKFFIDFFFVSFKITSYILYFVIWWKKYYFIISDSKWWKSSYFCLFFHMCVYVIEWKTSYILARSIIISDWHHFNRHQLDDDDDDDDQNR